VEKAKKARATRELRHTRGPKEKLKIKGEVPVTPPTTKEPLVPPAASNGGAPSGNTTPTTGASNGAPPHGTA
jgi:hypothetical protein